MVDKESPAYSAEQLRAVVYRDHPNIFNGLRNTLSELQSILRTYAPLQKYEVTQNALNAIVKLLGGYLLVRNGDLMMPSSIHAILGPTDFEFDTVLTEAMEGISAVHKAAIRGSDVQLSQQVIDALEYLALQSVDTKSLFARPDENPTVSFIRAYMFGPIQDGAARGLDDVTMGGARAQTTIAKALLRKRLYLTAQTTIGDLEKLAYLGVLQRKAHVTGTPVTGIAELLQLAVVQPIAGRHIIHSALDALQRICIAELQFKSPPFEQNLRFSIGAVLDITQPTALSNLEGNAIQRLSAAMEQGDVAKADEYGEAIRELNDGLWGRLVAMGTAAAKTNSLFLVDINTNISEIAKHNLWLIGFLSRTKPEVVDRSSAHKVWLQEQFADDILKDLNWIVGATYWRIFDALERPININVVWDFFPTLSHIGIQALYAAVPSLAGSAISELKSISLKAIGELVPLESSARIAVFIARIGIVAQKLGEQNVLDISVAALNEFQSSYFTKQREMEPDASTYDATLVNELNDIKSEMGKENWLTDELDATFFGRVAPEDIDNYLALLHF